MTVKEIADLNQVLKQRDAKLAEAQQAQADLIKKPRVGGVFHRMAVHY